MGIRYICFQQVGYNIVKNKSNLTVSQILSSSP